jgi:hypothetical protein
MNISRLRRVNKKDSTQWDNIHLLKFLSLHHIFGQSASVKIDVNKFLQNNLLDD